MRHFLILTIASSLWLATICCKAQEVGGKAKRALAVIDFDYIDTSGEERDQSEEHAARMSAFMEALKGSLANNSHFRIVTPVCRRDPCKIASLGDGSLLAAAREAGADVVLIGGVHKMSTLVQWAETVLIDTKTGLPLDKKLFTFRGDTDDSWRRAERFIFDEIDALPPS